MTRFFIDNKEIAPPPDLSSLSEVLKQVELEHLPPDSVVRKIQLDGCSVEPNAFSDKIHENAYRIDGRTTVEIFTGSLTDIARESIEQAFAYLDRIESATPSLAESFRFCPDAEAYENLRQLCEGFYWLNMLLDRLSAGYQMDSHTLIVCGAPAAHHHQKFISVLKQLIESQEAGDLVLISDLLEYEILPLVAVWREMLVAVTTKMKETQ